MWSNDNVCVMMQGCCVLNGFIAEEFNDRTRVAEFLLDGGFDLVVVQEHAPGFETSLKDNEFLFLFDLDRVHHCLYFVFAKNGDVLFE
eukprot:CAMPEP_0118697466 /NCGR_PEP_ID=MMETSP0800-20121206/14535_1 /TAXON_ID=210618 ORGANISM="Striatella unipunctata, Strain CCMP2910" /NCGR_SAMPLE_ID=MMETSP0800 /ASSEMBLY_ACC=CAM_ASM_000638 /LENGTH=87 /DNA_ID=CAMNT_0006596927 /DNA_START=115 /DNA_END=378 /DNA_ORIENTATION=-